MDNQIEDSQNLDINNQTKLPQKRYLKFFIALFGGLFRMFGWIKLRRVFIYKLLKKTLHDNRVPTDVVLDEKKELLGFYMEHIWPLIDEIEKEEVINFFKYKLKRIAINTLIACVFIALSILLYRIYSLYIEKPKVVIVERQRNNTLDGMIINTDTIFIPAERSELTKENLDYFASEMGIKNWYWVRNQIVVETGFTSNFCIYAHNLFGMKFPGQCETTAIGKIAGYSKYKHWIYSLYDYKLWQDRMMKLRPLKKRESYPQWLKRIGYAEDIYYMKAVSSVDWYGFEKGKN